MLDSQLAILGRTTAEWYTALLTLQQCVIGELPVQYNKFLTHVTPPE
jgi:hypothetical protein